MRILFTQETDWLGRNPGQQHHLAERLTLKGHEMRIIDHDLLWSRDDGRGLRAGRQVFNNVSKIYNGGGVTVIRPGITRIPILDYISLAFSHRAELSRQMREFKPDVVVGWDIMTTHLAMQAAKRNNIPFIYYWSDVLHLLIPFSLFRPLGRTIETRTLKQSDKILVINDKLKEYVVKLGASSRQTQVIRAGIDTEHFNLDSDGEAVRAQYGLKKEDFVLFFMGWLYNFTGLREVALELAKVDNYDLKLLIVGEGDAYEELQRIREQYNLQDRLILTGKKPYQEIPGFIAASDICLLPALPAEETMQDIVPIKLYEYMAMRKPVIATRLPGVMKEFGVDNGVIYVDRPEEAITKAMELAGSSQLDELGLKAGKFIEKYSWERVTDEFEKTLEEVIKEKKSGTIPERV